MKEVGIRKSNEHSMQKGHVPAGEVKSMQREKRMIRKRCLAT